MALLSLRETLKSSLWPEGPDLFVPSLPSPSTFSSSFTGFQPHGPHCSSNIRPAPASGPLHLQFPLPGMLFPHIATLLKYYLLTEISLHFPV